MAVAAASIIGAQTADVLGFEMVFILAGIGSIASAFILLVIPKLIFPRGSDEIGVENTRVNRKHKNRNTVGI